MRFLPLYSFGMYTGPPNENPNWLYRNAGNGVPFVLKKLRASMAEFRRNSNALPWTSLVPDLETTFTTAPELRPSSAL